MSATLSNVWVKAKSLVSVNEPWLNIGARVSVAGASSSAVAVRGRIAMSERIRIFDRPIRVTSRGLAGSGAVKIACAARQFEPYHKEVRLISRSISRKPVFAALCAVLGLTLLSACHDRGTSTSGSRDPSATKRVSDSPLHAAAERNDDATIMQLTGSGTSANTQLKNGRTALHIAAAGGQMRAATALLNAGADPGIADNNGETPLMMAAARGNAGMVAPMLAKHPPLDAQNKAGKTAVFFATEKESPDTVR